MEGTDPVRVTRPGPVLVPVLFSDSVPVTVPVLVPVVLPGADPSWIYSILDGWEAEQATGPDGECRSNSFGGGKGTEGDFWLENALPI